MDSGYDDDIRVSPSDVLGNAGPQQPQQSGGYYPAQSSAYKAAGMNPLSAVAPLFSNAKVRASYGTGGGSSGVTTQRKEPNQFANDANFYANALGDFGSAQSLLASKDGKAVFQMFDDYDFDMGTGDDEDTTTPKGNVKMRIVPKGERSGLGPDGKPFKVPVWMLARKNGVTNVPFKGGDEAADKFRGLLSSSQGMMKNLNELEAIYKSNALLTGFGMSEASAKARALEARILMDYARIMSESKGLGGQVSDRDLSVVQSMTPQRASNWFGRLRGNEMRLLRKVRSQTLEKLKSTAQANGLDLLPESQEKADTMNTDRLKRTSINLD
jgi:hypothetical protein